MLYIGEKVGRGGRAKIDIALDPLEGTTITAKGGANAIACLAMAAKGNFLNAPDTYMQKIAVGPGLPDGVISLTDSPATNLARVAEAKGLDIGDMVALVLDRPRHTDLIAEIRKAGARVQLINDGDVAGVIATAREASGVDIYMGSGGAPEGVLAAAALRCIGGQFQGKLLFRSEDEKARAKKMGVTDFDRIYRMEDLAKGDVTFCATGVTDGTMLQGVRRVGNRVPTQSILMRSKSGTVRTVLAEHNSIQKRASHPDFGR
jgi:fructose-1,6-bisphosphatase II / sedoheptulose-1,7-bisphosphatase